MHGCTDTKLAKLKHQCESPSSKPADTFTCAREPGIHHSPDVILVKLSDGSTVCHVPDTLACVLASMLDVGQLIHMEGTTVNVQIFVVTIFRGLNFSGIYFHG